MSLNEKSEKALEPGSPSPDYSTSHTKADNLLRRLSRTITDTESGGRSASDSESVEIRKALVAEEEGHDIKFRTLSWQKATLLLFGEYVCLAILALPWTFSVLGWGCSLVFLFAVGLTTWYTSYILWQFCMKYPHARDVCDIAAELFPGARKIAYHGTAFMLLVNNTFIIGFHVFTGAKILNTLSDHSQCTVVFQVISAIIGIVISLPRTLHHVSLLSVVSAAAMGISILLALVFAGIEDHPSVGYGGKYPELGPVQTFGGFPFGKAPGFVDGFNAVLNITFLWIGQILYPSFIGEMKEPRDFPKALAALTFLEMVLFTVVSVVGYYYLGQYAQAPMVASFSNPKYVKASFAFVIVPTFVIGGIYGNVACKFVYKSILGNSRHAHSHTVVGWGTWIGIVIVIWVVGFVLGNIIPSMGDFLSIMSAAFDSFFGYIFWTVAYYHLNRGKLFSSPLKCLLTALNVVLFLFGLFLLGPGLYTSVQAIVNAYKGGVKSPFSCMDNSIL